MGERRVARMVEIPVDSWTWWDKDTIESTSWQIDT